MLATPKQQRTWLRAKHRSYSSHVPNAQPAARVWPRITLDTVRNPLTDVQPLNGSGSMYAVSTPHRGWCQIEVCADVPTGQEQNSPGWSDVRNERRGTPGCGTPDDPTPTGVAQSSSAAGEIRILPVNRTTRNLGAAHGCHDKERSRHDARKLKT